MTRSWARAQHRARLAREGKGELISSCSSLHPMEKAVTAEEEAQVSVTRSPEAWLCRICWGCGCCRCKLAFAAALRSTSQETPGMGWSQPTDCFLTQGFPQAPKQGLKTERKIV